MDGTTHRSRAADDLRRTVSDAYVWNALALAAIRSKYRLSTLGTFWITLSTGALAVGIGILYGQFFGQDISQYLPYFVAGFTLWTFVSSVIGEGANTLIGASGLIKGTSLPIVFHVLVMIQRHFIIYLHNLAVLVAVWLWFRWPLEWSTLLAIPGFALCYLFMIGLSIVNGIVCVRFRDVPPLVGVLTQFLFFASPVIWHADQLRFGQWILYLNPVAYFLMTVREPLIGHPVWPLAYVISALLACASLALGAALYLRYRGRIAYWV